MRQPLVTRKNRKLRRLKELYPDVRIKLLYRRDYDLLVHSYAARGPVLDEGRPGRVVFSAEQIDERIHTLAGEIGSGLRSRKSRTGEPPLLLAAGRGAATFAGALGEALQMQGAKCEVDQLALSRYRNGGGGRARVRRLPAAALAGRRVLLATELVSTGLSTAFLTRWLHQRGCLAVEHVALLDRKDSRLIELPLSHVAFEAPADLLVGYGLQLRRQYASLPHIALLDSDGDAG